MAHEIELITYHAVDATVGKKTAEAGFDVNLNRLFRHVTSSSSLQAEAAAEDAALGGIQH